MRNFQPNNARQLKKNKHFWYLFIHSWRCRFRGVPRKQSEDSPELVKKLFETLDDGTFRVQKDTNSFHQWRKIYEQNIAKDKKESLPEGVMLHSHFHGDMTAMDASL